MKLKRLIFLMAVQLLAAMGPRPGGEADGQRPYVRGEVPAARDGGAEGPAGPAVPALVVLAAGEVEPAAFLWKQRPLVIFADTPADPDFTRQLADLQRDPLPLLARDVVVITDSDPAAGSIWRRQLHPEGFSLLLLDKDGQGKQRKPAPRSVREISRAHSTVPLRRRGVGAGPLP